MDTETAFGALARDRAREYRAATAGCRGPRLVRRRTGLTGRRSTGKTLHRPFTRGCYPSSSTFHVTARSRHSTDA